MAMATSNQDIEKISFDISNPMTFFLRDLVNIRSYSGDEGQAVARTLAEFEAIGCDEVWQSSAGDAMGRIGHGDITILYDAHLDTIEVANESAWSHPPCEAHIENGYLSGLGACDCKGGVASIVYGAAILKRLAFQMNFSLIISCSTHEESVEGFALRLLIENDGIRPDFVIIAEPTDFSFRTGQRGRCEIRMRTNGKAAHASQPHLGESAIIKMLPVIEALEQTKSALPTHPVFGHGDQTISMIASPNTPNSVPEWCELTIDRRIVPGETLDSVLESIQSVTTPYRVEASIPTRQVSCHNGNTLYGQAFYPGWQMADDAAILTIATQAYRELFESQPLTDVWQCSTNGTYSAGIAGIPTIGFGPQELKYLHVANERVNLERMRQAAMFYALFPLLACRYHEKID